MKLIVITHHILVLADSAVKSFFARIMPKLMFTPMTVINGSLETTVVYMVQAAEWIYNLVQTSNKESTVLTPFQFDLCFAVGEPKTMDEMVGDEDPDDSDDDDNDDNNGDLGAGDNDQNYVDYIGNIEEKLKNNEMKNAKKEIAAKNAGIRDGMGRVFDDLYKQYLEENPDENAKDKWSYLQSKRLVTMIDRRHQDKKTTKENPELKDSIFMYEPPADSRIVPTNAVPEWFVASSRQCLLPGLDVCSRFIPGTVSILECFEIVFSKRYGNSSNLFLECFGNIHFGFKLFFDRLSKP